MKITVQFYDPEVIEVWHDGLLIGLYQSLGDSALCEDGDVIEIENQHRTASSHDIVIRYEGIDTDLSATLSNRLINFTRGFLCAFRCAKSVGLKH